VATVALPENLAYVSKINTKPKANFADYSDGVVRDDFMGICAMSVVALL
jgi:hypothetical protein